MIPSQDGSSARGNWRELTANSRRDRSGTAAGRWQRSDRPNTQCVALLERGEAVGGSTAARVVELSTHVTLRIIVVRLYRFTTVTSGHWYCAQIYKTHARL